MERYQEGRKGLQATFAALTVSDQQQKLPPPPPEKPYDPQGVIIPLPKATPAVLQQEGLWAAIFGRRSRRNYKATAPLGLEELAFLLEATQGVQRVIGGVNVLRPVPSAGARHAFETYLFVHDVAGLAPGVYRYLSMSHALYQQSFYADMAQQSVKATLGQQFTANAQALFVWSALPYRMEWRYDVRAHKLILLDAGHLCQNLYLAGEGIGKGVCAIAAYDQDQMDRLIGADPAEEMVIYSAALGGLSS